MMKKIYAAVIGIFTVSMLATAAVAPTASAVDLLKGCDGVSDSSGVCSEKNKGKKGATNIAKKGIDAAIYVLGMICIIMVVVSGFLYSASNGDSTKIQTAKNTLMYAIIGLIVAILSFAIVNFVIKEI